MINNWTSGYVADIAYTYGYYTELNPLRAKLALISSGYDAPQILNACELGFGQGLSANLHASGSLCRWFGTDFNPSQAAFAQSLAQDSENFASLFDESFEEFSKREMPDFDYIGLHGIWSWISDENRQIIVDFVRRKLKVGGVLYISYNTLPGWSSFAPMRHLMTEHSEVIGADGAGIVSRINDAIDFSEKLLATNPAFSRANPLIKERIEKLKGQNRHYLAHEYFNRDWHPMHFAEMHRWLTPAKLNFAVSATLVDLVEAANLSIEQQEFLATIPDPMFKQSVRDFMVNQQFRRDYWVKGPRKLNGLEQIEKLRAMRVSMLTPATKIELKFTGAAGEVTFNEGVYRPIIEAMADHKPKTIEQIENAVRAQKVTFAQVVQAMQVLTGLGHVSPANDEAVTAKVRRQTDKMNAVLMAKARGSADINYLASPVVGGGVVVDRIKQIFLLAMQQGKRTPEEAVNYAHNCLKALGQRLVKEGRTIESEEDNRAELANLYQDLVQNQLPILKALQVV